MADFYDNYIQWMYWTPASLIFFGAIVLALIFMTIWDIRSPSIARRGFLPIATTRGDRLFISIMTLIGVHLVWLAVMGTGMILVATAIATVAVGAVARWG